MKTKIIILWLLLATTVQPVLSQTQYPSSIIQFDFCGAPVQFTFDKASLQTFQSPLSEQSIQAFYASVNNEYYHPIINALKAYKEKYKPDDWLFYQLIRKTAQYISPKADDYLRYTLYKWFLLTQTGYDAFLAQSGDRMLFYVRCNEDIYNIPTRINNNKQYVCLNYHDYGEINFLKERFTVINVPEVVAEKTFSYKIRHLPEFSPLDYQEKDLHFTYDDNDYHFRVKLNPQITYLFKNYPTVDYKSQLNIPLSKETYQSLIPLLKKNVKGMSKKNGVDYLMRFTRYAFLFQTDTEIFGSEKRLSPEQTLFYAQSDCEDRVALFFCLVKEIYNLPMIVLAYPKHVTIAVQFDKPRGKTIEYNGQKYSICEPTPQKQDLKIGEILPELHHVAYEVAYAYNPRQHE